TPMGDVSSLTRADSFVKIASAIPDLGQTEVGLELAGLSPQQVDRFQVQRRRVTATRTVDDLIAAASSGSAG
ncbi:MAG: hypothetical protein Q4F67_14900, partial [Propionibacteriaceae bacterium]|nr:hypothetical protein [Propionibacteriaceae bacterium]